MVLGSLCCRVSLENLTDSMVANLLELSIQKELGCVALDRNDLSEAEKQFRAALTLNLDVEPGHILTACLYYKLGIVQYKLGRSEMAL